VDASVLARLERVYSKHPVNADAVLDRVRRERGTLEGIKAHHLAESAGGGSTDQNHAGGAAAVRALAIAAGVRPGWTVLDIGTGLGGTPRLLAEEFGCLCHGVELTASRFRDAVRLTTLVGLDAVVTFTHGDFMTVEVPNRPFDLALGQGALMHFADLNAVLERIRPLLRLGGRLVVEDGVVVRRPSDPRDVESLAELLHIWNGQLQLRDEWPDLLGRAGFRLDRIEDLTASATRDFEDLLAVRTTHQLTNVTDEERKGWELALRLARSGHLGTVRLLATLIE
jgi:cyclopropane fatty-acyl-phospholipid synthase-like methyltransferase